jgi:hypothetical protein
MNKEIPFPTVIVITGESSDGVTPPRKVQISDLNSKRVSCPPPEGGVKFDPALTWEQHERLVILDEQAD